MASGRARRTSRVARMRIARPATTCGRSTSTSSTCPRHGNACWRCSRPIRDRGDDVRQITFWGGLDYRMRRLVPAPRRRRLPQPLPVGPRLTMPPTGRRPCWTRRGRDRTVSTGSAPPEPRRPGSASITIPAAAEAGHREVRLLRQRAVGETARGGSTGLRTPASSCIGRSASTTCTATRAGSSGTKAHIRARSCAWSPTCARPIRAQLRPTEDIERLLTSRAYRACRAALKALDRLDRRFPVIGRHLPRRFD